MADDIVTRLRSVEECLSHHECFECGSSWGRSCECLCHQAIWHYAADEIELLRSALDAEGNEANLLMLEIKRLRAEVDLKGYRLDDALNEIVRLRTACNDLYHDATCAESFCRLCGEGIKEWEARHG